MREMTKVENFGRIILILTFTSLIIINVVEFAINPPDVSGVIRVMLTAGLLLLAYRGYEIVHWITALFLLSFGLYNFVAAIILFGLYDQFYDLLAFITAVSGIIHVLAFFIIIFYKPTRAFLDYQRESAYTKPEQSP